MNDDGVVLADANPFPVPSDSAVGEDYATLQRPEVVSALVDGEPSALVRTSDELAIDLLLASAPIVDDPVRRPTIIGAVRITLDVQPGSSSRRAKKTGRGPTRTPGTRSHQARSGVMVLPASVAVSAATRGATRAD